MSQPKPLLKVENLIAGYLPGINIVNSCSLDLYQGEMVGIIGPNGAGKSTFLKAVFGLLEVRGGKVTLKDEDVTGLASHKLVSLGIGYVPQTQNVFSNLSVMDNLKMGAYRNPSLSEDGTKAVFDLFPVLQEYRNTKAGMLSGGEAQMVAIGRALMMNPQVLLLDEPSAGLSPINQKRTFACISDVVDSGVSVIMVEQNARTCLEKCSRAYVLDQGQNAYSDTGQNLLNNPKVIELYLGSLAKAKD